VRIRRDNDQSGELINISSLLDVMFILIIFFLATTTFQQEERDLKVNLPEAADGNTLSTQTSIMVINVRDDGTYLLGNEQLDINALQQRIVDAVKEDPDQKALIRGDERALHGVVAAAVLCCKRSGIHEANIGYQLPQ
jgi:biopolymer transport protein ExbD